MRKQKVITLNCGCLYSTRSPSELWGRGCAQQFWEEPEYTICPVILLTNPGTQKVKVAQESCPTLWDHGWKSPGKKTGVGCHSLLQGIFLTQGSNPGLLNSKQILGHQGSPYPDTQVSRLNQSVYMGKQDMETPGRAPKKSSGHSDRRSFWSGLLWGAFLRVGQSPRTKEFFVIYLFIFLQKDTHRIKNPI